MKNEKLIIEYVIHMVQASKTDEMVTTLRILQRLACSLSGYAFDEALAAIMGEEVPEC